MLRLGATAQTLESLISAFLTGFRRAWPGIDVRLVEDGGVRLRARVARGELHLALGAVPTGDDLRARPLFPVWVLAVMPPRSEEHTSELQSRLHLVCRLLLEKKKETKELAETTTTRRATTP